MKKILPFLLAVCLLLTACAAPRPSKAVDGAEWDDTWVTVGNMLGVDVPEGLTLRDNNDSLASQGMYIATWSSGEEEAFVNKDGNEVPIYDAQINVLLAGFREDGKAEENMADWLQMAQEQYSVTNTVSETHNGQEYTVLSCTYTSETNPYDSGAAAFGVYLNCAVAIEVSCRDKYEGSAGELLQTFLDGCRFAAE